MCPCRRNSRISTDHVVHCSWAECDASNLGGRDGWVARSVLRVSRTPEIVAHCSKQMSPVELLPQAILLVQVTRAPRRLDKNTDIGQSRFGVRLFFDAKGFFWDATFRWDTKSLSLGFPKFFGIRRAFCWDTNSFLGDTTVFSRDTFCVNELFFFVIK